MAHIITNIGYEAIRHQANNKMILNCMRTFCTQAKLPKSNVHNSEDISKRIDQAAKVKQQLEGDIFERDKIILQSAEAKKKIGK